MVSFDFYIQAALIYIPTAALLSYILAIFYTHKQAEEKSDAGGRKKGEASKPNRNKGKTVEILQKGKIGYCKYCEKYLLDNEYYKNHIKGKRHKENSEGFEGNWLSIIDEQEYNKIINKIR